VHTLSSILRIKMNPPFLEERNETICRRDLHEVYYSVSGTFEVFPLASNYCVFHKKHINFFFKC